MSYAVNTPLNIPSNWAAKEEELHAQGWALLPKLIGPEQARDAAALYENSHGFRSRIVMNRHGFGRGEYRYFSYPLPELIQKLRTDLYVQLAPIANAWHDRMGMTHRFPATLEECLRMCHRGGQERPTPLLLKYGPGDFNCLHQDLYGEYVFPLQAAILLSQPGDDFEGGEFVLIEQRPRMQSRVQVIPLGRGDAVIFAVHNRPVQGTRGHHRVRMKHGVSAVSRGQRHVLGIIFHDAK
jgi:hypothetical protein